MKNKINILLDDNYEDFIKAIISIEKGVNDQKVLNLVYEKYMNNDSMNLLNEEFDYIIDISKEEIKNKSEYYKNNKKRSNNNRKDLKKVVGYITGDVKVEDKKSRNGSFYYNVINFSVLSKSDSEDKNYNVLLLGKLANVYLNLKKGDLIELYGKESTSGVKEGKKYINFNVRNIKLLKQIESIKNNNSNENKKP